MKRGYILVALLVAASFALGYGIGKLFISPEKKISIFLDSIYDIARQKDISFKEAAQQVYDIGYRGVDAWTSTPSNVLELLDSIGFSRSCAITYIDFCNKGECEEQIESTLQFMKNNSFDKVLLVPGCFSEKPTAEQKDSVVTKVRAFSDKAAAQGLSVLIEDFDDPCSPCMNTDDLNRFFAACPSLGHVYDSGNYPFCGEDEVEALKHFLPLVKHVHFKDRSERGVKDLPAIGSGIVRFAEILEILQEGGYDGWITVEIVGDNLYDKTQNSYNNLVLL